jgi:hypothetical protein
VRGRLADATRRQRTLRNHYTRQSPEIRQW